MEKNIKSSCDIASLLGDKDKNSIIQVKEKTRQESKSTVSFDFSVPISETETRPLYDKVKIEELRYLLHSPDEHCRDKQEAEGHLVEACGELLSLIFFIHVCGYTAKNIDVNGLDFTLRPIHYGFNEPTAPTSKRIIRPHGVTKDEDLTDPKQHSLTLDLIDQAVIQAKCADRKIRPISINNREFYVLYLHPTQVTQLRNSAGAEMWRGIQTAKEWMHLDKNQPLFQNSLGIYHDVILRDSTYVTQGIHSTENTALDHVRRAVLLGRRSAIMAFGKNYSFTDYDIKNYEKRSAMALETILGMKKTRFTNPYSSQEMQDFGAFVIPTYAVYKI
ncbi:DUF4043 family protein [Bartonella sp. ML70XJBT.G]|uniref:phage capsid family protein n=1 Tax=Bartonella sp. ML70XJBT.G TaxID=3019093 RepID=UPI00235F4BD6|nr:DUF4043 family protein [Bartonella sp. ML70XJBT.G]